MVFEIEHQKNTKFKKTLEFDIFFKHKKTFGTIKFRRNNPPKFPETSSFRRMPSLPHGKMVLLTAYREDYFHLVDWVETSPIGVYLSNKVDFTGTYK